jgi:hypothetical protein
MITIPIWLFVFLLSVIFLCVLQIVDARRDLSLEERNHEKDIAFLKAKHAKEILSKDLEVLNQGLKAVTADFRHADEMIKRITLQERLMRLLFWWQSEGKYQYGEQKKKRAAQKRLLTFSG